MGLQPNSPWSHAPSEPHECILFCVYSVLLTPTWGTHCALQSILGLIGHHLQTFPNSAYKPVPNAYELHGKVCSYQQPESFRYQPSELVSFPHCDQIPSIHKGCDSACLGSQFWGIYSGHRSWRPYSVPPVRQPQFILPGTSSQVQQGSWQAEVNRLLIGQRTLAIHRSQGD